MQTYKLDNGKYLVDTMSAKYGSGILFLSNYADYKTHSLAKTDKLYKQVESFLGSFPGAGEIKAILVGTFRKTQKGRDLFEPDPDGSYIYIQVGWGGSFSETRGYDIPTELCVFARERISNGGGLGFQHYVVKKEVVSQRQAAKLEEF